MRARQFHFCPCHLRALHTCGRRAEDQATQQSVAKLREIGIVPDILVCRTEKPINEEMRQKISLFCNVPVDGVIEEIDVEHSIYEVPLMLQREKMDALVCQELGLETSPADMSEWEAVIQRIIKPQHQVRIGVIGKYIHLQDAYKSVYEAVTHAGGANDCAIEIVRVDSEDIERDGAAAHLAEMDGILVPGGFGERGVEGKVLAAQYARKTTCPISASASACRSPALNLPDMPSDWTARTQRSLTPRRPTPSSLCSTNSKTSPTWEAPCAWRAGLCAHARQQGRRALRHRGDQRTPSAPVRIQQRLP